MIKRYTCRWAKKADSDKMLEMVHPSTPRGQVTRNRLEPLAMRIFCTWVSGLLALPSTRERTVYSGMPSRKLPSSST